MSRYELRRGMGGLQDSTATVNRSPETGAVSSSRLRESKGRTRRQVGGIYTESLTRIAQEGGTEAGGSLTPPSGLIRT